MMKNKEILLEELKNICKDVVKYIQEANCGPIVIGDMIRAKYNSYWKDIDWESEYENIEINVNAELEIMQYGAVE